MKDLITIVFIVILITLISYQCSKDKDTTTLGVYFKGDSAMKARVGQKVLIGNDSVIIVDYSFFKDSYTLSNGITVNKKLIDKTN